MMKRIWLIPLVLLVFTSQSKPQKKDFDITQFYPIEASHSYIGFNVKYMGYAMVRGRFAGFSGTIRYDENNLANTSVTVSIDVNSIDTDHDFRDRDLKSENWFDAEKFPKITFESTGVTKTTDGMLVSGNLTIKDVTNEVILRMDKPSGILKDVRGDAQVIFTGGITINRKDYNVAGERWSQLKEGITAVESDVNIELSILGKQIKESNFRNWVRNPESPPGKIFKEVEASGVQEGLKVFEALKADESIQLNSGALNLVGYMLLKMGRIDDALTVFERNKEEFPDDGNVYDSLGEAWAYKDPKKAKTYFQTAIQLNPENLNAKEILRHLN